MPSMIGILSLNDHYGCSSFCTSALNSAKQQSTVCESMPMCLSSSIAIPISSTLIQSGMSVYDSFALMMMHMSGISLSLFVSWLCLDNQSVKNSCGTGLYSIIMFNGCILHSIFEACVTDLQHFLEYHCQ